MTPSNDEGHARAAHGPPESKHVTGQRQRNDNHQDADEQEDDIPIVGFKPLLPEGQWFEARFDGHATVRMFATVKCLWEFTIVEPGEWFGTKVFRAFRVNKIIGRPCRNGKFVLVAGGDMYTTLVELLDVKQRRDRITLRPLKTMLFRVKTRTVVVNYRQQAIADHARYSVIDEIRTAN